MWRLDQIWPDDPTLVANYMPLRWDGTRWFPLEHHAGGQPAVNIESGTIRFSVRGSWTGNEGQRIAGLAFLAPADGRYHIHGKASSKPWEGGSPVNRLGLFKMDTQRGVRVAMVEMPRSGEPVDLDATVELSASHELVVLPLMPDWHNATTTTVSDLTVENTTPP